MQRSERNDNEDWVVENQVALLPNQWKAITTGL